MKRRSSDVHGIFGLADVLAMVFIGLLPERFKERFRVSRGGGICCKLSVGIEHVLRERVFLVVRHSTFRGFFFSDVPPSDAAH